MCPPQVPAGSYVITVHYHSTKIDISSHCVSKAMAILKPEFTRRGIEIMDQPAGFLDVLILISSQAINHVINP
jgi:hypothetical protein